MKKLHLQLAQVTSDYKEPQYHEEWDTWIPNQPQNQGQHNIWSQYAERKDRTKPRELRGLLGVTTMNDSKKSWTCI